MYALTILDSGIVTFDAYDQFGCMRLGAISALNEQPTSILDEQSEDHLEVETYPVERVIPKHSFLKMNVGDVAILLGGALEFQKVY